MKKKEEEITPEKYFHLFVGFRENKKVEETLGKYLDFLLRNINNMPNQGQILNQSFEYNLEKCKDYFSSTHRQLRETLDSDIKETRDKLLNMLKDPNLKNLIDKNHVLLLFKLYKFTPGVTKVCDMLNLRTELIDYYIEQDDINEILNFCKLNGTAEPNLWIIALNYFCSPKETKLEERLEKIPEILESVKDIANLSPMLILKMLKSTPNIKIKHIKKYFIYKLQANRKEIEEVETILIS